MQLRPYQTEAISKLRDGFRTHQRQVLCLPTGAGKTVVFSEMVRLSASKGTVTLVLTDRIELFGQTFRSLERTGVVPQLIHAGGNKTMFNAVVTVGMVETIARRLKSGKLPLSPSLIIIDEAHKGNFNKIIEAFPEARIIGATATPVGKHFYQYYTNIVSNIDIPDLVDSGYLAPCKAFQMQDDLSDLSTKAGEYTDQSLFNHYNKTTLYDGVIQEYQNRTPGKKAIVFNVNIAHAERMTESFRQAGIASECVTSKTPKEERAKILRAFSIGAFPVLNNCGILTTGYDEPSIEVVIMNRATKSLPLWLQCCGRGSRPYPGKEFFTVLDFGMNHDQHGLWSEARNWRIRPPKEKKQEAAPVKKCPKCEAINPASARICQFCAEQFKIEKKDPKAGIMVEVTPRIPNELLGKKILDLDIPELIQLEQSKKYSPKFIWRIIRSMGEDALKEYAGLKGYKSGWIYRQTMLMSENEQIKNYTLK